MWVSLISNMLLLALFESVVDKVVLTALVVVVDDDDTTVACYGYNVKEGRPLSFSENKR